MRPAPTLMVLLLASLALAGCTGGPQEATVAGPTGRIDGAVVDRLLHPIGNTTVTLKELNRTDVTSPKGGFTFRDLPPGFYTISVDAPVPDGEGDRAVVAVYADQVTRYILQVHIPPRLLPYVSTLEGHGALDVALPGGTCDSCTWTAGIGTVKPDSVVVRATWNDPMVGDRATRVVLEVLDDTGRQVDRVEGFAPLWTLLPADAVGPDTEGLTLRFSFPDDNLPQPGFELESFVDLYYGVEPVPA